MRFANLNFGHGAKELEIRGSCDNRGGFEILLDSPTGQKIAGGSFPKTLNWYSYKTQKVSTTPVPGIHDVYIVITGDLGFGGLDWFRFVPRNPDEVNTILKPLPMKASALPISPWAYTASGRTVDISNHHAHSQCRFLINMNGRVMPVEIQRLKLFLEPVIPE